MRFGPASVLVLAAIPLVASGSTRNLKGKDGDKAKHHHRHKKGKKEKTAPGAGGGGEPLEEGEGRPWGGRADLPNSHMGLYQEGPVYGLAPPLGGHPYGQYGASPWQGGPSYQPPPALYPQQPNGQPLLPPLPPPPAAAPAPAPAPEPAPEPAAPESGCPPQTFRGEIAPNYYHQAMLGQNDEVHQFYNEGLFPRGIDIDIDIKVLGIDRTDFTIDEELNFNFIGVDVDPYGPPPYVHPPPASAAVFVDTVRSIPRCGEYRLEIRDLQFPFAFLEVYRFGGAAAYTVDFSFPTGCAFPTRFVYPYDGWVRDETGRPREQCRGGDEAMTDRSSPLGFMLFNHDV